MADVGHPLKDFTRTWRYKVGLGLIIIGNAILVVGILLPVVGPAPKGKAGLVGLMIVGGELISLASIAFLGKEGFKAIKSKIFGAVRAGYVRPVGRVRHYIGIVLLCSNVVTTYLMVLYAWDSFRPASPEGPHLEVWGLGLAQQESLVLWLWLVGDLSFLIAIYVLGAEWWGRVRKLFVWQEPEG